MIKDRNAATFLLGFVGLLCVLTSAKVNVKICRAKNGLFPKSGSLCKAYYKCRNWVPEELQCPFNQHFNTVKKQCDWMDLFPCFEKPKTNECPRDSGKFLKPGTGCRSYYDCCNGIPTEKQCPQMELFDPSKERCEWIRRYTCIESVSTDDPTTSVLFSTLFSSTLNEDDTSETPEQISRTASTEHPSIFSSPTYTSTISNTPSKEGEISTNSVTESVFTLFSTTSKNLFSTSNELFPSSTSGTNFPQTNSEDFEIRKTPYTDSEFPDAQSTSSQDFEIRKTPYTESDIPDTQSTSSQDFEIRKTPYTESDLPDTQSTSSQDFEIRKTPYTESYLPDTQSTSSQDFEIRKTPYTESEFPDTQSTSSGDMLSTIFVQSTPSIWETTPEEIEQSTFVSETSEEIIQFTTIPSTTFIKETTSQEIVQSTTRIGETSDRTTTQVSLPTTDVGQVTREPNILCPEPFGYFPHPTDKHKFVGCVDNVPSVLTCPSDLVYNDELRQCIYE